MVNIFQARTNTITISDLYSKVSIPDASLHYLFNFRDFYNSEVNAVLVDYSSNPERYSTFYFTDGSDGTLRASGEYNIYESPIDSSTIDASIMNLLENGQYTYVRETESDVVFDPSLFDYKGYDVVFDPVFGTGAGSITAFPHNDLLERDLHSNHPWALPESSLGPDFIWDGSLLHVTGDDASIAELYNEVSQLDASISRIDSVNDSQDSSIDSLFVHNEAQDVSISFLNDYRVIQDASIAAIDGVTLAYADGSLAQRDVSIAWLASDNADQDVSINYLYQWQEIQDASLAALAGSTLTYIDGSLSARDASIAWLRAYQDIQDASIAGGWKPYVDPSLAARDVSIAWLRDYQIIQDASIAGGWKPYVDPSLAARDTSIAWLASNKADTSYVDASLSARDTSIAWLASNKASTSYVDASLATRDLYIDGSLSARDTSIALINSVNISQDSSISALRTKDGHIDTSLNSLWSYEYIQDTSIALKANTLYVDASLSARDTSIAWLRTNKLRADASLNDLSDVSANSPSQNQVLTYLGGQWVPADVSGLSQGLDDLTDVEISTPSLYDILWLTDDSSLWKNAPTIDISALFYDRTYIDSSIKVLTDYTIDLSTRLDNFDPGSDASIIELYNIKADKSSVDSSLSDVYTYVGNLPQDSSIASLYSTKQNAIADGTYVKEASLGDGLVWNAGQLDVSASAGLTDVSLGGLTDVSLNTATILNNTIIKWDSSSAKWIPTLITSITEMHNDLIGLQGGNATERYHLTQAQYNYLTALGFLKEASLGDGLFWVNGSLDVSVVGGSGDVTLLYVDGSLLLRDASISYLKEYVTDLSTYVYTHTHVQDPSIADLYQEIENLPQDASIGNLYSSKQNNIPDGTFVKESSIGDGLFWVGGSLDVSVAGGGSSTLAGLSDVSIKNVAESDSLMYESSIWKNKPTTDIADILVDISDILVDATDLFYTKTAIDASFYDKGQVDSLIADVDVSVKGALNMIPSEPCDASIYAGLDASGNLQFKRILGTTAVKITEYSDYIDINIDASFAGEVNAAANIGAGDASIFISRDVDGVLDFRTFKTNSSEIVLTNDSSYVYIDASIDYSSTLSGLSDVAITNASTGDSLMFGTAKWENKPTVDIDSLLVDIADILVEADSLLYSKTQIDASFALKTETVSKVYEDGLTIVDGSIVFGDYANGNYLEIYSDGTVRLHGDATGYDDLFVPLFQTKQGNTFKPDVNYTEVAYMFPRNDTDEILYFQVQIPHRWKEGSRLYPHVHYRQADASTAPVYKLDYKIASIGGSFNTAWQTYTMDTSTVAWVDSSTHQLNRGDGGIDASTYTKSAIMLCKLYRDDDVVSGDVPTYQFDIHYEVDSFGSETEFTKI